MQTLTSSWKRWYDCGGILWSQVARRCPDRGLVGRHQLKAWDITQGTLRSLTHSPGGTLYGLIAPDGEYVYYHADLDASEMGHFVRVPFEGGEPEDLTPDLPSYEHRGFGLSRKGDRMVLNPVNREGFQFYCLDLGESGEAGPPRLLYRTTHSAWGGFLSYDGEVVALSETQAHGSGPLRRILVLDAVTGDRVASLKEESGHSVVPEMFSPLPGDVTLLATSTRTGFKRPLLWNPVTGEHRELRVGRMQGDLQPYDWSEDGRRILLSHFHRAVQKLCIYDLETDVLTHLHHPSGSFGLWLTILGPPAYFSPEPGHIWAHWQDGTHPLRIVSLEEGTGQRTGTVLKTGESIPGRAWTSVSFPSSDGEEIQAWLCLPEGDGPHPTVMEMHGGPHFAMTETFHPKVQAWAELGFAYVSLNYRGSTTFGWDFERKIWGDIGRWELEDMVAARTWLVEKGHARSDAVFLTGGSYGGFLTLWGLCRRPELWAGGMAVAPAVDWRTGYEEAAQATRGAYESWFFGTPDENPGLYRDRSPLTHLENISAPVLVFQGRQDVRSGAGVLERFEAQMKAAGKEIEVVWYEGGHGPLGKDSAIRFQEKMSAFMRGVLRGKEQGSLGPTEGNGQAS
jgi:dipeptidyl aminopeptidase/acylaminoacyl peptidase